MNTGEIRKYLHDHPQTTAPDLAQILGCTVSHAHNIFRSIGNQRHSSALLDAIQTQTELDGLKVLLTLNYYLTTMDTAALLTRILKDRIVIYQHVYYYISRNRSFAPDPNFTAGLKLILHNLGETVSIGSTSAISASLR